MVKLLVPSMPRIDVAEIEGRIENLTFIHLTKFNKFEKFYSIELY